jgi:hypothetical protein
MAQMILAPVLVAAFLTLAAGLGFIRFIAHVPAHQAPAQAGAVDIDSHRDLAACYRDGCSSTLRSPVMGCAWRMVIVVQTRGAPEEAALAAADCGSLQEADRLKAEQVKEKLLQRHTERGKA